MSTEQVFVGNLIVEFYGHDAGRCLDGIYIEDEQGQPLTVELPKEVEDLVVSIALKQMRENSGEY